MNVAKRVANTRARGIQVAVVVSAMGDTTDELLELAGRITARPPERETALLLSTGELVSAALLSMALREIGCDTAAFSGPQAGVLTDGRYLNAKILEFNAGRVKEALESGKVAVVVGFQGADARGDINTLGRVARTLRQWPWQQPWTRKSVKSTPMWTGLYS